MIDYLCRRNYKRCCFNKINVLNKILIIIYAELFGNTKVQYKYTRAIFK